MYNVMNIKTKLNFRNKEVRLLKIRNHNKYLNHIINKRSKSIIFQMID